MDSQCGAKSKIPVQSDIMQAAPAAVPLHDCQTLEEHVVAAATLARAPAVHARSPSPGDESHTPQTPELGPRTRPSSRSHSRPFGETTASCMSAQQLCSASRALLLAANAAECMCDSLVVQEFTDSLISWLLRMPSQCALAVLLARPDVSLEEVISPNHALWCSRSDGTAARQSQSGTEPSSAFQIEDSDSGSQLGSDSQGAFAEQVDPGKLWLQIRYLSKALSNELSACSATIANGQENGLTDKPGRQKLWALYLSQVLRLALIAAEGHWDDPQHRFCVHSRYGPQILVKGFAITEEWMAPEFIHALWHPGATPTLSVLCFRRPLSCHWWIRLHEVMGLSLLTILQMSHCQHDFGTGRSGNGVSCGAGACTITAELLLPLRPVLVSPVTPQKAQSAGDASSAIPEGLEVAPSIADTAPFLHPDPSTSMAVLPEADASDLAFSEHEADSPSPVTASHVELLFSDALVAAPVAALAHIRHVFEELYPEPQTCPLRVKQLYVAVLERQGTPDDLIQAVGVLAGCGSNGDRPAVVEPPLQDLTAAVAFVAKHCQCAERLDKSSGSELCTALWGQLLHCTTGPQRVLVQYFQSQVLSPGCVITGHAEASESDTLAQLSGIVGCDGDASDESELLLKDAAPALSSLMKAARGQSSMLTLQRCACIRTPVLPMLMHCLHPLFSIHQDIEPPAVEITAGIILYECQNLH